MYNVNSKRIKNTIRKYRIIISNWEYWSFSVLYIPIYFYWFWLSLKAKSFFFFSTSNPSIENGGFMMESKKAIYDILPTDFYPKTVLIKQNASHNTIKELIATQQLQFPLVAKPNIGERGTGVKKLYSNQDVFTYQENSRVDFLLQEWCSYPQEIGVFYSRYPNQKNGLITGIVKKEFFTIVGNGANTVEELVLQNDRYFLQYEAIKNLLPNELTTVLQKGEEKILIPYGNHCRGTKFVDVSSKIDNDLQETFNTICNKIPGFYFGRLDIRYESWELLKKGKNFSIIELNGAGSEPTHIYDPRHTVFFAWKEIIRHLNILYKIAEQNKKAFNLSYLSLSEGLELFKQKRLYNKLLKTL